MRGLRLSAVLLVLMPGCVFPAMAQNRKTATPPRAQGSKGGGVRGNNPQRNPAEELRRFEKMSPEQREKQLSKLPPARRQRMEQQLQRFDNMPPARRERAMQRLEALQSLPPERRVAVRQQIQQLRNMPPRERRQWLNSDEMRQSYSPAEQKLLRESFNLPPNP